MEHAQAVSTSEDPEDRSVIVLKAGFAVKQGHFFRTWKKRWCILRTMFRSEIINSGVPGASHAIVYYKTNEDAVEGRPPCGSITIAKGQTFISRISKGLKAERGTNTRECLEIQTPGYSKVYYFQPTVGVDEWMRLLTELDPPENFAELRRMTLPTRVGRILNSDEDADDRIDTT